MPLVAPLASKQAQTSSAAQLMQQGEDAAQLMQQGEDAAGETKAPMVVNSTLKGMIQKVHTELVVRHNASDNERLRRVPMGWAIRGVLVMIQVQ